MPFLDFLTLKLFIICHHLQLFWITLKLHVFHHLISQFFSPNGVLSLAQKMFFKSVHVFLVGQNGMKLKVSVKPEVCAIPSVLVLLLLLPMGTARLDKHTEHTP